MVFTAHSRLLSFCILSSLSLVACEAELNLLNNDSNGFSVENNDTPDAQEDVPMDDAVADVTPDPCQGVQCGDNASCNAGVCACTNGHEGDASVGCTPIAGDPCAGVQCGANASCAEGACVCADGFEGNATTGCTAIVNDPCSGVECGANASCSGGTCSCSPGFEGDPAAGCTPPPMTGLNARTEQQVCDRWNADYPITTQMSWDTMPADQCALGVMASGVQDDAIRRTNVYRWLVGLGPVSTDATYIRQTQACATTHEANSPSSLSLSHQPPSSWPCWSQDAYDGASKGNLSAGRSHPSESIDGYIADTRTPSLGHRRWIFNHQMGKTGFGQRGRYSCMYAFDRSAAASTMDFVGYPAPGFFPKDALLGEWSISSTRPFNQAMFSGSTSVSVTRDGQPVNVTAASRRTPNYGPDTFAWKIDSSDVQAGATYTIAVTGISGSPSELSWTTTLSACP